MEFWQAAQEKGGFKIQSEQSSTVLYHPCHQLEMLLKKSWGHCLVQTAFSNWMQSTDEFF